MYYFIVNPASKSHQGMEVWKKVEKYLGDALIEYKVYFSKCSGHVKELMYDICSEHLEDENPANIIILGGDGTYNEAIQGVISFDKVNIGYIPSGSGNDFARAIGYSDDPVETVKRILNVKAPKKLDIGKVRLDGIAEKSILAGPTFSSTRYFNVSCGIGFDAAVCAEVLETNTKTILNKLGLGKLVYGVTALNQLFSAKLCDVVLTLDSNERIQIKNCRFIAGMNTAYEGGGFKFAPNAIPTDGLIDVITAGNMSTASVLCALPLAPKGKHLLFKKIKLYRVKSYEVMSKEPLWVHTDGEVHVKADHINVSVVRGGINFLW